MKPHFIFQAGEWEGEGSVSFTASEEKLPFKTLWNVENKNDLLGIIATQTVTIEGYDEPVENNYIFADFTPSSFRIQLESEHIGQTSGNGVIDESTLGWEFREHPNFQGFEVYTRKSDDEYTFHAEFNSPDQFSTIIDGKLKKK